MPRGMTPRRSQGPPSVSATAPRRLRRLAAAGVLCALALAAPLAYAGGSWLEASAGSWAIVEGWRHVLGAPQVTRVTTTLVGHDGGVAWFRHVDDGGRTWEDNDPGAGLAGDGTFEPGGHDELVTRQELRIDGVRVPCRVIVNEKRGGDWGSEHAVRSWVTRSKRWEAADTTLRVRVLKVLDLGTVIEYRDGRSERRPGLSLQRVTSLRQPVRVHGRTYDCWVRVTKTLNPDSSFAGRTTVWGCDAVPTGWVRRMHETRDARTGAMSRYQEQLVDFRIK